jgi:hypothetical protein
VCVFQYKLLKTTKYVRSTQYTRKFYKNQMLVKTCGARTRTQLLQSQYPNWIFYFLLVIKYLNRASSPDASDNITRCAQNPHTGIFWCAHQDSNLGPTE